MSPTAPLTAATALVAAIGVAAVCGAAGQPGPAATPGFDLRRWAPPDIGTVGDDAFGRLVKYGHALTVDTPNQIGPQVADPARRYAGNNLSCGNCHLGDGTQPYALPLSGVLGQFPQYRAREGGIGTLEDRINGCMERSLNGRALPLDGTEMKAFLAYAKWLSTGIPVGARLEGAGVRAIAEPARAADPAHGAAVYAGTCAVCHGADARGQRAATGFGYQYPPLAGPDSYNIGAGMARILTAAGFIRSNMPLGVTSEAPGVSDDDAYDVAAWVNGLDRPGKTGLEADYPHRLQKPVDAPYGPWADGFPAAQHRLGPFGAIRARIRELAAGGTTENDN